MDSLITKMANKVPSVSASMTVSPSVGKTPDKIPSTCTNVAVSYF